MTYSISSYRLDGAGRPPDDQIITCPKCKAISGDDWTQCKDWCPMKMSPHYVGEHRVDYSEPDLEEWRKPTPELEELMANSKPVTK